MLDTLELTEGGGSSALRRGVGQPHAPIGVTLLRVLAVVALFAALRFVPFHLRNVVLPILGVLVPALFWSVYVAKRSSLDRAAAAGAGLVITLAGWSVVEFAILLCRLGASLGTSLVALVLLLVIPLSEPSLQVRSLPRGASVMLGRVNGRYLTDTVLLLVPLGIGAAIVERSMHIARQSSGSQALQFAVFWLGVLVMLVPLFVQIAKRGRVMTAPVIVVLSAAVYLPYWLRSPLQPAVTDEIAHWGETVQMFQTGRLFVADHVVTMGPHFPGLETLTVGLSELGGGTDFRMARVLVLLFHAASVLGIYQLGRVTFAGRTAPSVLAAALYAISPAFLLVDSWYSYESFAVPLMIWALVALILYAKAGETDKRPGAVAALLFFALIITHHLTSYVAAACIVLLLFPAAVFLRRRAARTSAGTDSPVASTDPYSASTDPYTAGTDTDTVVMDTIGSDSDAADTRDAYTDAYDPRGTGPDLSDPTAFDIGALSPRRVLGLGVAVSAVAVGWAVVTHAAVIHYLIVFPKSAFSAAGSIITGHGLPSSSSAGTASGRFNGTRNFGSSYLPVYEHVASVACQVLLLVWFVLAVKAMWPRRNALNMFLASFGLLYFLSLPTTFISGAGQGAHRSWAFSFVGLVLTLPYFSPSMPEIKVASQKLLRLRGPVALFVVLIVLLVGNYGSSVSAFYRFPGKFIMGADGRGYSPDMIRSAEWFRQNVGTDEPIVTTGRDFIIFGSYAQSRKSTVNGWTLFFPTTALTPAVQTQLLAANTHYVVVDTRLDTDVNLGAYFELWEPKAPASPLPRASIQKFSNTPWLTLVHADGFTKIFRVTSS